MLDAFSSTDSSQDPLFVILEFRRNHLTNGMPDHFFRRISKNSLCGWIPTGHDAVQVFAYDGIVRGLDDGCQPLRNQKSSFDLFRRLLLLVDVQTPAQITLERSVGGIAGNTMIENPAEFASVMS